MNKFSRNTLYFVIFLIISVASFAVSLDDALDYFEHKNFMLKQNIQTPNISLKNSFIKKILLNSNNKRVYNFLNNTLSDRKLFFNNKFVILSYYYLHDNLTRSNVQKALNWLITREKANSFYVIAGLFQQNKSFLNHDPIELLLLTDTDFSLLDRIKKDAVSRNNHQGELARKYIVSKKGKMYLDNLVVETIKEVTNTQNNQNEIDHLSFQFLLRNAGHKLIINLVTNLFEKKNYDQNNYHRIFRMFIIACASKDQNLLNLAKRVLKEHITLEDKLLIKRYTNSNGNFRINSRPDHGPSGERCDYENSRDLYCELFRNKNPDISNAIFKHYLLYFFSFNNYYKNGPPPQALFGTYFSKEMIPYDLISNTLKKCINSNFKTDPIYVFAKKRIIEEKGDEYFNKILENNTEKRKKAFMKNNRIEHHNWRLAYEFRNETFIQKIILDKLQNHNLNNKHLSTFDLLIIVGNEDNKFKTQATSLVLNIFNKKQIKKQLSHLLNMKQSRHHIETIYQLILNLTTTTGKDTEPIVTLRYNDFNQKIFQNFREIHEKSDSDIPINELISLNNCKNDNSLEGLIDAKIKTIYDFFSNKNKSVSSIKNDFMWNKKVIDTWDKLLNEQTSPLKVKKGIDLTVKLYSLWSPALKDISSKYLSKIIHIRPLLTDTSKSGYLRDETDFDSILVTILRSLNTYSKTNTHTKAINLLSKLDIDETQLIKFFEKTTCLKSRHHYLRKISTEYFKIKDISPSNNCVKSDIKKEYFIINGGPNVKGFFSAFRTILKSYHYMLFDEKSILLNAGGPENTGTALHKMNTGGELIYKAAKKSNIDAQFNIFADNPPDELTVIYNGHGSTGGFAIWQLDKKEERTNLTHGDLKYYNSELPDTTIKTIVYACHAGATLIDHTRKTPKSFKRFIKHIKYYYPKNRCGLAISRSDETTWSIYYGAAQNGDLGRILQDYPNLTLKQHQTISFENPKRGSSPEITTDYLLEDLDRFICQNEQAIIDIDELTELELKKAKKRLIYFQLSEKSRTYYTEIRNELCNGVIKKEYIDYNKLVSNSKNRSVQTKRKKFVRAMYQQRKKLLSRLLEDSSLQSIKERYDSMAKCENTPIN